MGCRTEFGSVTSLDGTSDDTGWYGQLVQVPLRFWGSFPPAASRTQARLCDHSCSAAKSRSTYSKIQQLPQRATPRKMTAESTSRLLSKLLKQFSHKNHVCPFALVGREETRRWVLCPGQRTHRAPLEPLSHHQLARTRWHTLTSYGPRQTHFCYLQDTQSLHAWQV